MGRRTKTSVNAELRAAQLRWLQALELAKSKTHTELARPANVDPSTLSKFKSTPGRVLQALTISQLAQRWDYAAGIEITGAAEMPGLSEEALPYKPTNTGATGIDAAIEALREGRNNCSPWTVRTRALEAIGILPGDIVLVDLSANPSDGDAVLAQVYDFDRMKATTVWRRYRTSGKLELLVAASFDPDLGEPVLVNDKDVTVKGVVLPYRLRPVKNAA